MAQLDDFVTKAVEDLLEKILCRPKTTFSLSERLVEDLHIASDDLTELILALEHQFDAKVPIGEWRTAHTGFDAIALIRKYLPNISENHSVR